MGGDTTFCPSLLLGEDGAVRAKRKGLVFCLLPGRSVADLDVAVADARGNGGVVVLVDVVLEEDNLNAIGVAPNDWGCG